MTMTLDEVPAKLNELDLRVPLEVFDAIDAAIHERADLWSKWQAERCFRAKAEAELAALKARIEGGIDMGYPVECSVGSRRGRIINPFTPSKWIGKSVRLIVEE